MKRLDELYEELIEYYSRFYALPRPRLEKKISELQERGYSREEAIVELYKEVFGVEEVKIAEEIKIEKPKVEVTKHSLLNLLSYSYNAYTHSPCLVLSIIFKDSLNYISSALIFIISLYLLNEVFKFGGFLNPSKLSTLIQENIYLIAMSSILGFLVFVLVRAVSSSVYWSIMVSSSAKLFKHERITLRDLIGGLGLLPRVLKAELIAQLIRFLAFIPVITLIVHTLANIENLLKLSIVPFTFISIILSTLLVLVVCLVIYLVLFILTIFVPHEVIISNKKTLEAILGSFKIARKSIRQVVVYIILLILTFLCAALISGIFRLIHVSICTLISFIISMLVIPTLDIALTGVYLQWIGQRIELWEYPGRISEFFKRYLKGSLKEVVNFIKSLENLPFIISAVILFMSFYALGLYLGGTYFAPLMRGIVRLRGSCPGGSCEGFFRGALPLFLTLEIFFNNWKIAMISSLGGLFYVVPPLSTFVSGLFLGLVASRLKLVEFLVLIMPHGCLELSAFVLSVAAGIKFSFITLANRSKISEALRETTLIAIGLAMPLIAAAFIEAFVTPQLAKLLLGWS